MAAQDKVFFDTNILVYLSNEDAPFHAGAVRKFKEFMKDGAEIWISRQVLREYAVVMSRPENVERPLKSSEIAEDLNKWQKIFNVGDETNEVTQSLIDLLKRYDLRGKRIHDANIVATMITHDIKNIFTYNTSDFRMFKEISIFKGIQE